MSNSKIVAAALVAATALSGCAGDPYSPTPRQDSGVLTGALAGGALGALLGGRGAGSRVAGAAIGAVAGGLIGGAVGASLDERDRQIAYAAEMQALESGQPGAAVSWRGEQSGYYGSIVPGPYYASNGRRCRQYTHTVYINGRPEVARGTACRNPDGIWVAVS
jgi:surface antigen